MFAVGAVIPLIPYLLGYSSLVAGLVRGGVGLIIAGGLAARFTQKLTPLGIGSLSGAIEPVFDFDRAISLKSGLRPAVCGCSGIVSGVPSCLDSGIRIRPA